MLPATQWKPDAGVVARLLADPSGTGFFQAVRLLSAWLMQQGISQEQVFEDYLRLHGSASLRLHRAKSNSCGWSRTQMERRRCMCRRPCWVF